MYSTDSTSVLAALIGLIMIVTFFIMSVRLKRIMVAIEGLAQLEFKKPENRRSVTCDKCKKEFTVSIVTQERTANCPHCQAIIEITPHVN